MQWNKEILRGARLKAKLSQTALANELGVHFRIVQNWEKGIIPIPITVNPALDKILGVSDTPDYVPREEYNKVVAALDASTELNKKLTDIIQSGISGESKNLGQRKKSEVTSKINVINTVKRIILYGGAFKILQANTILGQQNQSC